LLSPVCIFTACFSNSPAISILASRSFDGYVLKAVSAFVCIQSDLYFYFFYVHSCARLTGILWFFFRLPVNRSNDSSTLKLFLLKKTLYLLQKFGQPLSTYCSTMRRFRYIESSTEINVKSPPYWSPISKCLLPVGATDWSPLVIDL
jgi:hypothetical protein